tara:strand:+ start:916 stop:1065 length:150 start_codon:yes stop_codon:yes gene_type:complete
MPEEAVELLLFLPVTGASGLDKVLTQDGRVVFLAISSIFIFINFFYRKA